MLRPSFQRFLISIVICLLLCTFAVSGLLAQIPFLAAMIQLVLFAMSAYVGRGVFLRALGDLQKRRLGGNFFAGLAVLFGVLFSLYEMFMIVFTERDAERLMFAPCSAIITVALICEYILRKTLPTDTALDSLKALRPGAAAVLRDGAEVHIPADEIYKGDIVAVKPGETIPCDGEIIAGRSDIDENIITGAILPVYKGEGESIKAGCLNLSGFLTVRASGENAIDSLISAYRESLRTEQKFFSHRYIRAFGLVSLAVAILVAVITLIFGSFDLGIFLFSAILVVLSPCGFLLSRAAADLAAKRRGAADGIDLKKPSSFVNIGKADTAVIDRTGTATVGKLSVTEVITLGEMSEASVVRIAAALCAEVSGADFTAITEHCRLLDTEIPPCIAHERLPSKITGLVDGKRAELSAVFEDAAVFLEDRRELLDGEKALRAVFIADEAVGVIVLCDKLKPNAQSAIKSLSERGITTLLITGGVGADIVNETEELGADGFSTELTPPEKADFIRDLRDNGKIVVMIGDGVSDCAAMKAADFSFALGSGAEAAGQAASAVLMRNDLRDVIAAIELSEAAERAEKVSLCAMSALRALSLAIASGLYAFADVRFGVFVVTVGILLSAVLPCLFSARVRRGN